MAGGEILVKIGDSPTYEDGDILCAFNRNRIRCVHAEHLCHYKLAGRNRDGNFPINSLTRWFLEYTMPEKVNVLNSKEWLVENRVENSKERVPATFYSGLVFGKAGKEFFYQGKRDTSDANLNKVWTKIFNIEGRREGEEEFQQWPMGRLDIQHHLAVRTEDFTTAEREALVQPLQTVDGNGVLLWQAETSKGNFSRTAAETQPENILTSDGIEVQFEPVLSKRRRTKANWEKVIGDLRVNKDQVKDRDKRVGEEIEFGARKQFRSKRQKEQPRSRRKELLTTKVN